MAAKPYSHGQHAAARPATTAKLAPHIRHNVDTESSASRERMARPYGAKPRTAKDWS